MSTCGYSCPQCEGKEYLDTGEKCDWCNTDELNPKIKIIKDELNNIIVVPEKEIDN